MDTRGASDRYFAAWNARDPDAIAASFAPEGTYRDPGQPDGLDAKGTGAYAAVLFAAFPDLAFAVEDVVEGADGLLWARWRMTGTNAGPFQGLPPSGREIDVPGADMIHAGPDGVRSVQGFFDTGAVPRQLGLQVIVQPEAIGPFEFGVVTGARRSGHEPGAVTLTVLETGSGEDRAEVRERSRATVQELMGTPGFISWLGVVVGRRMYTITAWDSPEAVAGLGANAAHRTAMDRFFAADGGLASFGQTGIWAPHRLNGTWVRCAECGEMTRAEAGRCSAGHALPEAPAYW